MSTSINFCSLELLSESISFPIGSLGRAAPNPFSHLLAVRPELAETPNRAGQMIGRKPFALEGQHVAREATHPHHSPTPRFRRSLADWFCNCIIEIDRFGALLSFFATFFLVKTIMRCYTTYQALEYLLSHEMLSIFLIIISSSLHSNHLIRFHPRVC